MSRFYTKPSAVIDGDVAYAADVNDVSNEADAGFTLAVGEIDAMAATVSAYSDLAEQWANEAVNTEITSGNYSALHFSNIAEQWATGTPIDNDGLATGDLSAEAEADRAEGIVTAFNNSKDTSNGIPGLTLLKISFMNVAATIKSFFTNSNTVARTYTFPDKDLTVAGTVDLHDESHTVASHSDTSATGAELDTLTDGSDADDLHVHNHLVASGSGLPVVVVSALGATSTTGKLTVVDFEAGGDITVGGTVDGRDIATDGTKLDGIATGSDVSSGLEAVTEGGSTGWRLIGKTAANYGDIGSGAVDLSNSASPSSTVGTTGVYSFSAGWENTVSGTGAIALGTLNTASGEYSRVFGYGLIAINSYSTSIGKWNVGTDTDTVLEVGIGASAGTRANALEIFTDGTATLPGATMDEVQAKGDTAIATLSYIERNGPSMSRPTTTRTGQCYFDSGLGYPIWWNGNLSTPGWVDATGTSV